MQPERERNLLMRWAIAAWTVALLVVCARSALMPWQQNVLPIFTLAGEHWRQGEVPYGAVALDRDVFRYSPLAAALFAPMGLAPESVANVLWRLVNAGALLAAFGWWLRVLLPEYGSRRHLAVLGLLLLPLALPSLNNGQVNPLLVALMLVGVAAVQSGRFALAGVCLALACWLKVYPIALALLLIALYGRRFLEPFLAAMMMGFVLPFLCQEPGYVSAQYANWVDHLWRDDRQLLPINYWLRDARLLLRVWLVPLSEGGWLTLQLLTGFLIACLCWGVQRRGAPEKQVLLATTALAGCWMTVFGPATESCTWIVLGPSLVTALLLVWPGRDRVLVRHALLLAYLLLAATHLAKWFPWGNALANLGTQALAGLVFFICAAGSAARIVFDGGNRYEEESPDRFAASADRDSSAAWARTPRSAVAETCGAAELS